MHIVVIVCLSATLLALALSLLTDLLNVPLTLLRFLAKLAFSGSIAWRGARMGGLQLDSMIDKNESRARRFYHWFTVGVAATTVSIVADRLLYGDAFFKGLVLFWNGS